MGIRELTDKGPVEVVEIPVVELPTSFKLISCDLSLNRPAFALINFDTITKEITIEKVINVEPPRPKATHGEILYNTANEFAKGFLNAPAPRYFVREAGFIVSGFFQSEMAKFKVVGVMDFLAYRYASGAKFDEIAPKSVKKIVTGDGNATKFAVAEYLPVYVGKYKYKCQDESDAVAVGIAWLIKNGYIESKATAKEPKVDVKKEPKVTVKKEPKPKASK